MSLKSLKRVRGGGLLLCAEVCGGVVCVGAGAGGEREKRRAKNSSCSFWCGPRSIRARL